MRIISGKFKGRVIPSLPIAPYRPSTSYIREAVFNILTSANLTGQSIINNAKVLDLFAATGSLAFEALSRGASFATLIDINKNYLNLAKQFASKLQVDTNSEFLCFNALHLPKAVAKYNLVFIDPPYKHNLVSASINTLQYKGWLESGAIIVIELSKDEKVNLKEYYSLLFQRKYGNTKILIYQYSNNCKLEPGTLLVAN